MIAKFFFLARSLLCWRALHSNDGRFDLCVCGLAYRMSAYECISSKSFDMMATIAKWIRSVAWSIMKREDELEGALVTERFPSPNMLWPGRVSVCPNPILLYDWLNSITSGHINIEWICECSIFFLCMQHKPSNPIWRHTKKNYTHNMLTYSFHEYNILCQRLAFHMLTHVLNAGCTRTAHHHYGYCMDRRNWITKWEAL